MKSDFLAIDPLRLDEEWVKQPTLFFRYARLAANARRELDKANTNLDVVVAECDRRIRTNPSKYGLDKITESGISTKIDTMKAYQDALGLVSKAKYDVDIYQAATNALEHRKRALTMLVDLAQMEYYSDPKSRGNGLGDDLEQKAAARRTRTKVEHPHRNDD